MTTTINAIALGTVALIAGGLLAAGSLGTNDPAPPMPRNLLVEARADQPNAPKPTGPWKEAKVLDHAGWLVGSVAYSHDGKSLFVGGTAGHARAYETANWKKLWEYKGNGPFSAVACAPDDKTAAVTFKEGTTSGVRFLDAKTGGPGGDTIEERDANNDWPEPLAVAYFPDSVVIGGGTEPVSTTRKVIYGNPREYLVKTWLVGGQPSTIRSSVQPAEKKPADAFAVPLAVDPSGKRAVVTGPIDRASGKNVLWAWSAGSGVGNKLLEGHKAVVVAAAWSKDGNTIVTGDVDGVVITWDASTFKEKSRLSLAGRIAAVAISADGKHTAAALAGQPEIVKKDNYREEVFVWPTASPPAKHEPISRHQVGGPFSGVASVAFAPDGQTLVAAFCNFDHLTKLGELMGKVRIFTLNEAPRSKSVPAPLNNPPLRKFQGVWKLDGFEQGGGNKLTEEEVKTLGWTLTIEGNKFNLAGKDGKATGSGRIAVDDSQKPPVLIRIETDRENDLYTWCLYEIDGDNLRLCQDVRQKGKPKEFKATADTTIATYKRVKK